MATYATVEDFEAYVPGWNTDDADALEATLVQAERDIDMAIGRYSQDLTTGLKLDPDTLEDWRRDTLVRATCAQAQYRMVKGDVFFVEQIPTDPSGPDGSQKGTEPVIGPQAQRELSYGHFYNLIGRSQVPFPNQNWRDEPW